MPYMPSIRRQAALALSPGNVAEGMRILDALIATAVRKIKKRELAFVPGRVLAILLFVYSLTYVALSQPEGSSTDFRRDAAWAGMIIAASAYGALVWVWIAIQTRGWMLRYGRVTGLEMPPALETLVTSYSNGARELRTETGTVVPATMFASQWAILLFSEKESERCLVRSRWGVKQVRQILEFPDARVHPAKLSDTANVPVIDEAPDAEGAPSDGERQAYSGYRGSPDDEPPLRNTDPKLAWLLGGTLTQFKAGLDELLEDVSPRLIEAYRIIFTEGRSYLRKDGTRGAKAQAIEAIVSELVKSGENRPGTSVSTIKKLLGGYMGEKDIRGYFSSRYG